MKRRLFLYTLPVALFLLSAAGVSLFLKETPVTLAPAWEVGQRWKVNVFNRAQSDRRHVPYPWNFRVTGREPLDGGRAVFTIKASSAKDREYFLVFKIRHPDMTLQNVITHRNGRTVMNEAPQGSAFFFNPEGAWSMPLDFSAFPVYTLSRKERGRDLSKEQVVELSGDGFPVWQRSELTRKVLPGRVVTVLKIKMTATGGGGIVQNYQLWQIGKAWPTDIRRTVDGRLISEAVLIDD